MRLLLFGATGYTGRLTAQAMVRRGLTPVLLGRDPGRLGALADDLGGLDVAVADAGDPPSLAEQVGAGDVLVTTVGPFARVGWAALRAAVAAGATYIDSTGEPSFLREVFTEIGPRASSPLLPAFGYDYVPGNLAGALALRAAGALDPTDPGPAHSVEVGYFMDGAGGVRGSLTPSSGTLASAAGVLAATSYAHRGDRVVPQRPAATTLSFSIRGRVRRAVTVGGTEHWQLPRLAPALERVDVGLGWFDQLSLPLSWWSALSGPALRTPLGRAALTTVADRLARRTGAGPSPEVRERSGSHVVAVVRDAAGRPLAQAQLSGPEGYGLTAQLLAWVAAAALDGGLQGVGAQGPVDAVGLDALVDGAASCGLVEVPPT